MTSGWWFGLISLFFPDQCPFCQTLRTPSEAFSGGFCQGCEKDIHWITSPFCPGCGLPYPAGNSSHLCSNCLKGKYYFDRARGVVLYRGIIARALHRFKYHKDFTLSEPLGRFWKEMDLEDLSFDAIVPVPLHLSRLRERGFNQALLMGKTFGRGLGKEILPRAIKRIRDTLPQVHLNPKEREKNVRGAFAVRDQAAVRDRRILLVDDVYTTGATVNECAKILKKAGAREVSVLTLARVGLE